MKYFICFEIVDQIAGTLKSNISLYLLQKRGSGATKTNISLSPLIKEMTYQMKSLGGEGGGLAEMSDKFHFLKKKTCTSIP